MVNGPPLVLVVDDEEKIRQVARAYLEADGCEVVEAPDGEAALERFAHRAPDVVVLDLRLPGIDGLEVLRQLRSRSEVYVIVLTARAEEVTSNGRPVRLSALEFDLLSALAGSPGRVFTRRQLLERVWGYDFFGDERVIDVHIRNLRRALGEDGGAPQVIGTVRGVGYRFLDRAEP